MESLWIVKRLVVFSLLVSLSPASGDTSFSNEEITKELHSIGNSNHPNSHSQGWSKLQSQSQNKWLINTPIPNYMQAFLSTFQDFDEAGEFHEFIQALFTEVTSEDCKGHVLEWILRFVLEGNKWTTEKDKWAAQMADAWGKIPEGILTGHISAYGDFDECVQAKASEIEIFNKNFTNISKSFEGKYCTSYLLVLGGSDNTSSPSSSLSSEKNLYNENILNRDLTSARKAESVVGFLTEISNARISQYALIPSIASCMPNSCPLKDIQVIQQNAALLMYYSMNVTDIRKLPLPLVISCSDAKGKDLDAGDISYIVILSILFALCLGAGVVDYFLNHGVVKEKPPQRGLIYKYFMAFSFYTNIKKWMDTRRSPEDLGCLHGIRFFSTSWVVILHSYFVFSFGPQWNRLDLRYLWRDWTVLAVLNGTLAVDTFFVLSGMLITISLMKMFDKTKGKLDIPKFIINRIFRITPTYMMLVGLAATITIHFSNGPMWFIMDSNRARCRKYWWVNLLYINNIHKSSAPCNGETWYLANDMQYYLLSPLIIYPIWKWRKIGIPLLAILTVLSCVSPALVSHFQDTPPSFIMTWEGPEFENIQDLYVRPWTRIQTFLVGIWLGWILTITKGRKIKLPWWIVAIGWIASTAIALTVVFSIRSWFNPAYEIPKAASIFYAGLHRFAFGLCISWVIFACLKGYGGIVNDFLSWTPFMVLGRICFCVYLVSVHVQSVFHLGLRAPIRYEPYLMVNLYLTHLVMSFLMGFLATMMFEVPFMGLQRLIFEGK